MLHCTMEIMNMRVHTDRIYSTNSLPINVGYCDFWLFGNRWNLFDWKTQERIYLVVQGKWGGKSIVHRISFNIRVNIYCVYQCIVILFLFIIPFGSLFPIVNSFDQTQKHLEYDLLHRARHSFSRIVAREQQQQLWCLRYCIVWCEPRSQCNKKKITDRCQVVVRIFEKS